MTTALLQVKQKRRQCNDDATITIALLQVKQKRRQCNDDATITTALLQVKHKRRQCNDDTMGPANKAGYKAHSVHGSSCPTPTSHPLPCSTFLPSLLPSSSLFPLLPSSFLRPLLSLLPSLLPLQMEISSC